MGKGYKGRNPRGASKPKDGEGSDDEEGGKNFVQSQRGLGNQGSTMGMLPPSGSDTEEEEEEVGATGPATATAPAEKATSSEAAPDKKTESKKKAAVPSGSSDDSSSEDDSNVPEYFRPATKKKEPVKEAPDPEQIRKDLERLELIRSRREADRLKRIANEGWDRYAAVTSTNHPPGAPPAPA